MANVDQNRPKRKVVRIADHDYLDSAGNVVTDEESAQGYSYTLKSNPDNPFVWDYSKASDAGKRMLALFGAKTLATNVTSGLRNKDEGAAEPTADEQLAAVVKRFELIQNGQWTSGEREGGVGYNADGLTEALCLFMVESGKKTQVEVDEGWKAKARQRIDEDPAYVKQVRGNPQIQAHYARIMAERRSTTPSTANDLDF
jgi:hypothetical protein